MLPLTVIDQRTPIIMGCKFANKIHNIASDN